MATPTELQVLRIPCDGSTVRLENISLVDIGPGGIDEKEALKFERDLMHIPNVKSLDPGIFSWKYRRLHGLPVWQYEGENIHDEDYHDEDYMAYLCMEEKSNLPQNKFVDRFIGVDLRGRNMEGTVKIFGDVLVFRAKGQMLECTGEYKRAEHLQMDTAFMHGVEHVPSEAWVMERMQRLLMSPFRPRWFDQQQ